MISTPTFPVTDVQAYSMGNELRPRWVFEHGQRTDRPVTDEQGRPLFSMEAVVSTAETGPLGVARIVVATPAIPHTQPGGALRLTDDAKLTVRRSYDGAGLHVLIQASGLEVIGE